MRLLAISLLMAALLLLAGCSRQDSRSASSAPEQRSTTAPAAAPRSETGATAGKSSAQNPTDIQDGQMKPASLTSAQNSQTSVTVTERKLIRNADIILESGNPSESQRKVSSIAEAHGGFVVSSESKQTDAEGQLKPETIVTVTIRVPAAQFDAVINELRGTGSRVAQDKITTQDVTEEYIDLEARIRAKQALEAQFMEIMKQARTVQDALEVQRQLSDVRAEIERYEGRRRFLENQTSLSTINITMRPPTQIVSTSGFLYSVKRAFSDGLDVAAAITLGLIQVFIALLPLLIFIGLPIFLAVRYLVRRAQRQPPRVSAPPPPATTAKA
jgi:major membrane immunogen (membrane-anchored lipoprotein)